MADGNVVDDLGELNEAANTSFIHYDPNRTDYTINDFELTELENNGNSIWKDVFLATLGLGIPTAINGWVGVEKLADEAPWTKEIFINFLLAGITLSLTVISFFIWQRNAESFKKTIEKIKGKPKYKMGGR